MVLTLMTATIECPFHRDRVLVRTGVLRCTKQVETGSKKSFHSTLPPVQLLHQVSADLWLMNVHFSMSFKNFKIFFITHMDSLICLMKISAKRRKKGNIELLQWKGYAWAKFDPLISKKFYSAPLRSIMPLCFTIRSVHSPKHEHSLSTAVAIVS